jgi:hypothetical protein
MSAEEKAVTETTKVKPGYKTTEFWLSTIAMIVATVVASGVVPETGPLSQGIALVAMALTAMGYDASRGKAKEVK